MPLAETAQLVVDMNLKGDFRKGMSGAQRDLRGFTNQANTTTTRLGRLQSKLKSPELRAGLLQGVGLSGGLIGFQLLGTAVNTAVNYMGDAVTMASDLQEAQSKVDEVFEGSAPTVRRWASELDASFGISERAALKSAGTLGNFLTALGQSESAAADMSTKIVELAGDLASFNNTPIDDVLTALQAGLAGETEPVRRLGIDISAARVETLLLEKGVKKLNGEFTQSQKTLGRYIAIMEDTEKAQGDAKRTSDTYAGSQRQLSKNLEDLQTTIGTLVLPALSDMAAELVAITAPLNDFAVQLPDIVGELENLQGALSDVIGRDVINDFANFSRIVGTGGLALVPDAFNKIQDSADPLGQTFEDLVGEGTAIGDLWNSLAGEGTDLANALQPLGDAIAGTNSDMERAIVVTGTWGRTTQEATDIAADSGPSVNSLADAIKGMAGEFASSAQATIDAAGRLRDFKDAADEIADARSLTKINDELREQRKNLREAADAGNVRAFAAATAAIEQLQAEKELRKQGKQALSEYLSNTNQQVQAQQRVIQNISATNPVVQRLAEKHGVTTKKVVNMLNRQGGRVDKVKEKLNKLGKVKSKPKVEVRDQAARNRIARIRQLLKGIPDETVILTIQERRDYTGGSQANTGGGRNTTRRQGGGPVRAGRAYVVGERRPELFVPSRDGRIMPNVPSGGGGPIEVFVRPEIIVAAATIETQTSRAVRKNRVRAKTT